MKMYLRLSLTICLCLFVTSCRTTQLTSRKYEERTTATEKVDTLIERDSVMVFIHEKADTVRIVQLETKWRERVTLRHDTLIVIKTDTVTVRITAPEDVSESVIDRVTQTTSGRASVRILEKGFFAV